MTEPDDPGLATPQASPGITGAAASAPPSTRADVRAAKIIRAVPGYLWAFAALLAGAGILGVGATGEPLAFAPDALDNVAAVLAPLVVLSAFIERAVEVVLTPWRGDKSDLIRQRIDKHRDAGKTQEAESEAVCLREHRNGTRCRAFFLAVGLGLAAALLGFRAIGSLVETAPAGQLFIIFDVLVTGLVLGGGADGIHKLVNAFTDSMEMISARSRGKPAA